MNNIKFESGSCPKCGSRDIPNIKWLISRTSIPSNMMFRGQNEREECLEVMCNICGYREHQPILGNRNVQ